MMERIVGMISFESDYVQGAHPEILKKLEETNYEFLSGYGEDKYCVSAKEKILKACKLDDGEVVFLVGGTQTNAFVISSVLNNWEGVVSATSGHINQHEAGAIEKTGHKVISLPQKSGKICASDLKELLVIFHGDSSKEHMVYPGMVYISHPTEYGTLYTKEELLEISKVCREYSIPLFMDGARLGYALESLDTNLSLEDIARICDIFYIGGTKVGALCGEAVVFKKDYVPKHFVNQIKSAGALIAKGRLLGVQFDTLFTDNLYFKISKNAIVQAEKLKEVFKKHGVPFYIDSPTNQQFVVLPNNKIEKLRNYVGFGFWEKYDNNNTVVRFATSWATTNENIEELDHILEKHL